MNILSRDGDQIVDLKQAKANSRVTKSAEDSNFELWLEMAHQYVENYTNCVLQQSTCQNEFYGTEINLNTPVRGIVSVKTFDDDGVETIVTDYKLTKTHNYGVRITLDSCPENYGIIEYIAGFGEFTATTELPVNEGTIEPYAQHKNAILLLTNHFWENRGIVTDFNKYELPIGIHNIMNQVKKYL